MNFKTINEIKAEGFHGFKKISDLFKDTSVVPKERGNYFVLYLDDNKPNFLTRGVGCFYKGKDPNVLIEELEYNWVDDTIVINIGQAGGIRNNKWSNETLNDRIKKYIRFGKGHNSGHSGGKYIWQIKNYNDLVICWKEWPDKICDPKRVESELIAEFKSIYGKRPFANLQD